MERIKVGLLALIAGCLLIQVVLERRLDVLTRAHAQGPVAGPSAKCEAWEIAWTYKKDKARNHMEQLQSEMEERLKRFHDQGYSHTTFSFSLPAGSTIIGMQCMSR